jgi:hypothetical protein
VVEATETGIRETGRIVTTETRLRKETAGGVAAMFAMLLAVAFAAAFFRQTTKFGKNITAMFYMFAVFAATAVGPNAIIQYGVGMTLLFAPATLIAGMYAITSGNVGQVEPNKKVLYWAAAIYEALMAMFLILVW